MLIERDHRRGDIMLAKPRQMERISDSGDVFITRLSQSHGDSGFRSFVRRLCRFNGRFRSFGSGLLGFRSTRSGRLLHHPSKELEDIYEAEEEHKHDPET